MTGVQTCALPISKYIACLSNRTLFDVDELIEEKTRFSIAEIFARFGEAFFRKLETEMVQHISIEKYSVIACGGGVVLNPQNMAMLRKNGTVFCLWADLSELEKRINGGQKRPLLTHDLKNQLKAQLDERQTLYQQADYHVETQNRSIQEIGEEIVEIMQREIWHCLQR